MRGMMLGTVLDYCIEAENQRIRAEKKQSGKVTRRATQEDIDAYFGGRRKKEEE